MTQLEDLATLRNTPGFWYLANPYSKHPGGLDMSYLTALTVSGRFEDAGVKHYAPIKATHKIAVDTGLDPRDNAFWLAVDRPFMDLACGLVIIADAGWEESAGIAEEIAAFTAAGKPVYLYQPNLYPWKTRRHH